MGDSFNGLMGWSVFSQADTIMCCNSDRTEFGKGGKTNCSGCVGDEIEECSTKGDDCAIGCETIHHGFHGVFTYSVAKIATRPFAEFGGGLVSVNAEDWGVQVGSRLLLSILSSC